MTNTTSRAYGTAELFFIMLAHWLSSTLLMIFSSFPYRAQLMTTLEWAGEVTAGQVFKWHGQPHAEALALLFFLVTMADDEGVCIHASEGALLDETNGELKKKMQGLCTLFLLFFLNSLLLALSETLLSVGKERDKWDIFLHPCAHPSIF